MNPATFLSGVGVKVVDLPVSRMRNAGARLRYRYGYPGGASVEVCKTVTGDQRAWMLWHEAAHVVDITKSNGFDGRTAIRGVGHYGVISSKILGPLRAHADWLAELTPVTHLVTITVNEVRHRNLRFEDALQLVEADRRPRLQAKHFESKLKISRYRRQPVELFAEAVACGIMEPKRLETGAPGLLSELRQACANTGLPI